MDLIIIIILLLIYLGICHPPHIITGGAQYSIIFVSAITQDMANKSASKITRMLGKNWKLIKQTPDINTSIRDASAIGNIVVSGRDLSHSVIDSDIKPDLHIHVSPMPHSTPEELMANKAVIMAALISGGGKSDKPVDSLWDDYISILGKSSINSIIQYNNQKDLRDVCETYRFVKT